MKYKDKASFSSLFLQILNLLPYSPWLTLTAKKNVIYGKTFFVLKDNCEKVLTNANGYFMNMLLSANCLSGTIVAIGTSESVLNWNHITPFKKAVVTV